MKYLKVLSFFFSSALLSQTKALASGGDDGCIGGMRTWLQCGYEGISLLHPMNNSQLNLKLLVNAYLTKGELSLDEHGDYGDSSPCFSNNDKAVELFSKAVEEENFPPDTKAKLIELRSDLNSGCKKPRITSSEVKVKCEKIDNQNSGAQPFCQYLLGASLLYEGTYASALEQFENIVAAKNAWLSETAKYLTGRVALIGSQTNWTGYYKNPGDIDQEWLAKSLISFQSYLSQYPNGQYVMSTKGLLGKLFWLKGDTNEALKIVEEGIYYAVEKRSTNLLASRIVDSEIMEVFNIKGQCPTSPLMSAVCTLAKLRYPESVEREAGLKMQQEAVNSIKIDANKFPGLMELMRASVFVGFKVPEEALKVLAAIPTNSPPLILNTAQRLKAVALEQQSKMEEAFTVWSSLYDKPEVRSAIRPEFINNYILRDRLEDLIVKEKREVFVEEAKYERDGVISQYASEELLKKLSKEPNVDKDTRLLATSILLSKYLSLRSFDKFEHQYSISSKEMQNQYSGIAAAEKAFRNNPNDGITLLRYHEALSTSGLRGVRGVDPAITLPEKIVWPVKGSTEYAFYIDALEKVQKYPTKSNMEVEPKILSFLINCFRWGYLQTCAYPPEDVPESQRKKWFQRLKSKYKETDWAKNQKYYY